MINFTLPPLYPVVGGCQNASGRDIRNQTRSCSWNVSPWNPSLTVCTERWGVKWLARLFHTQEVPGLEFCPGLVVLTEVCHDSARDWLYWQVCRDSARGWFYWLKFVMILPGAGYTDWGLSWFCLGLVTLSEVCPDSAWGWLYWLRFVLNLPGIGYTDWGLSWFCPGLVILTEVCPESARDWLYRLRFALTLPGTGYTDWQGFRDSAWGWLYWLRFALNLPGIGYTDWGLSWFCPGLVLLTGLSWFCPGLVILTEGFRDSARDWLHWLRFVLNLPGIGYTDWGLSWFCPGLVILTEGFRDSARDWLHWLKFVLILPGARVPDNSCIPEDIQGTLLYLFSDA
jgi:hypothetical protein